MHYYKAIFILLSMRDNDIAINSSIMVNKLINDAAKRIINFFGFIILLFRSDDSSKYLDKKGSAYSEIALDSQPKNCKFSISKGL